MTKMKKIFAIIGVAILVSVTFFLLPFGKTEVFNSDEYTHDMNYCKELDSIPVMSQETGYTCYVVSMAIVKTYLGQAVTEYDLKCELNLLERTTGMLPREYLSYANEVFNPLSYSVSLVNPTSQTQILNIISDSLENNLPVIIFYSAADDWNKPNYNTHYGVIYGIDMRSEKVLLSNPYGYLEELSFTELFSGLDFSGYQSEPFLFRIGRKLGMVKENSMFIFERTAG